MRRLLLPILLIAALFYGCAANPVTGKRELVLVSEPQEIAMGRKNYGPSRQMQGGDYTVDPALTEYVKGVGKRLAAVSDRKLPYEFAVLNNSVPNAWAMPGGKIAVNRGLLVELKNEAELAAVLGHEIVHAAARHGAKSMQRGMLIQGAVMATGVAARDRDYADLAVAGAQVGAALITHKYGRDAEREADLYGMVYMKRAGYDPQAAVGLQQTFLRLSKNRRQDWISGLFASHPPSQERVENNRATAERLGAGGEIGARRYQSRLAHLKQTKTAYDAYDKGRKALGEGDLTTALKMADKAIRIEPREAHFYALRGDARFMQKRLREAMVDYNRAIQYNPDFFHYYVQRGITREKLGDKAGAKKDLERSIKLLPTATALNRLGNMALAGGDRRQAINYYKKAARSRSEPGQKAARSLLRLDLPQNPNNYLQVRSGLNKQRNVIVKVGNPTSLAVHRVRIVIQYPDAQGRLRQFSQDVTGVIPPGKAAIIKTPLGPVKDSGALRRIKVKIERAALAE